MIERKTAADYIFDSFNILLLTLFTLVFIYPMIHVVMGSLSDPVKISNHLGTLFLPDGFSLEGYKIVLRNRNILIGYLNTGIYVTAGTALNIIFTAMGAYVLVSDEFRYRKFFTLFFVFNMYVKGGIIPNFLQIKELGLYNSRLALILPVLVTTWNLIVMRTTFAAVPKSLIESAKMDGANDFIVLFKIVFPVAKATIASMALFYAVGHWNSWFNAMIYLKDRSKYPLQLFLREILLTGTNAGNNVLTSDDISGVFLQLTKYCTVVIATVPILFIYPFVQKYFTKGVMLGSLKE